MRKRIRESVIGQKIELVVVYTRSQIRGKAGKGKGKA